MVRFALLLCAFLALPAVAHAADEVWSQDVPVNGESRQLQRATGRTFELVGLHWRGSGSVLFRTRSLAGAWSGWRPAAPEPEDLPDRPERGAAGWRLGNPYWVGSSNGIEYRLRGDVRALRAWFVDTEQTAAPLRRLALAGTPAIIPRASWQADEKIVRAKPRYAPALRLAIVHHTAGATTYSPAASASIVRGIELYHVRSNGWNDIGYNFLVDRYGQVFEGRGGGITRNVVAAHTEGFNYGSVGVAVIGSYGAKAITPAARDALVKLLAWRLDVAHVDPASTPTLRSGGNSKFGAGAAATLRAVSGHRDAGATSCPGARLYAELPSLIASAAATGLPKLYEPAVSGKLGGPVRFSARLSAPSTWRVTVTDAGGIVVASGSGRGAAVSWIWDATFAGQGAYTWRIEAGASTRPAGGRVGRAPTVVPPTVPPAPVPVLSELAADPAIVSADGDGVPGTLTISYRLRVKVPVTAVIRNAEAAVVQSLFVDQVQSAKRQSSSWDLSALPDGPYVVEVSVRTPDGRVELLERDFAVARMLSGVSAAPAVVTPNGDGVDDTGTITFTLGTPADVTVQIEQGGLGLQLLFVGPLPAGTHSFTWGATIAGNPAPDGVYDAVVIATTALRTARQALPVTVIRTA